MSSHALSGSDFFDRFLESGKGVKHYKKRERDRGCDQGNGSEAKSANAL